MENPSQNNWRHPPKEADENYTYLSDIEQECKQYKEQFKGQRIYCNCDDARWSQFWKYFLMNFHVLGLKSLDATCFHEGQHGEHWHYEGGCPTEVIQEALITKNMDLVFKYCNYEVLDNDGSYEYQTNILNETDIIVTNPPFSLYKQLLPFLVKHKKKYLMIGPLNIRTYKEIAPLFMEGKVSVGYNAVKEFYHPDGTTQKFGNICWYTNLDTRKWHERTEYYSRYTPDKYPRYDNYDAIEIGKLKNIPCDWTGVMGVPITFFDHNCADQFEIIGDCRAEKGYSNILNGKTLYYRYYIKWKPEAMPRINEKGIIIYD